MTIAQLKTVELEMQLEALETLWNSIASKGRSLPVTKHEKRILDRTIEDFQNDPNHGVTWEQLKQEITKT